MINKTAKIDFNLSIPKGSVIRVADEPLSEEAEKAPDDKMWYECYFKENRYLIDRESLERDFE